MTAAFCWVAAWHNQDDSSMRCWRADSTCFCLLWHCRVSHLSLANNHLTGALTQLNWTTDRGLRFLNLSGNQFTGSLPVAWSQLRGPVAVDVSRNKLTGPLPGEWGTAGADGQSMALELLDVSANAITGGLS